MAAKPKNWYPGTNSCICCLSEGCSKDVFNVYVYLNVKEIYSDMLSETFDISIKPTNFNNKFICEPCISKLREAFGFKRQIQETQWLFQQYLLQAESVQTQEQDIPMIKVEIERDLEHEESPETNYNNHPLLTPKNEPQPITEIKKPEIQNTQITSIQNLIDRIGTDKFTIPDEASSKHLPKDNKKILPVLVIEPLRDLKRPQKHIYTEGNRQNEVNLESDHDYRIATSINFEQDFETSTIHKHIREIRPIKQTFTETLSKPKDLHETSDNPGPSFHDTNNSTEDESDDDIILSSIAKPKADIKNTLKHKITEDLSPQEVSHVKKNIKNPLNYEITEDLSPQEVSHVKKNIKNPLKHKITEDLSPQEEHVKKPKIDTSCDNDDALEITNNIHDEHNLLEKTTKQDSETIETKKKRKKKAKASLPPGYDKTIGEKVKKNTISILTLSTAYPLHVCKKDFRCWFCPETKFSDPTDFRQHMEDTHQEFDVNKCLKHPNSAMLRVDIGDLKCKECDARRFDDLEDLAKHLIAIHKKDIDLSQSLGVVPIRLEKNRFACVICSSLFSTLYQLSRHSGAHFHRHICSKCSCSYETLPGLQKHDNFSHSESGLKYYCPQCRQTFPTLNAKKEHMRTSKPCQLFRCNYCEERFLSFESQQKHQLEVHGKERVTFPCSECPETFDRRGQRYLHFKLVHTNDFKCTYCEMKYSNNKSLQDHIVRCHTFERKHQCKTCDKKFVDMQSLQAHSIVHDESRKHVCPICKKSYTQKVSLKFHVQKYHLDQFYTVFPAGEKFSNKV